MDDNDLKILEAVKMNISANPFILDIGANRGNYTDFVLKLFPNAKMILIEPNDMWIGELSKKYFGNTNIRIWNILVGKDIDDIMFYYFTNNNDQLSSIYERPVFSDLPMKKEFKKCITIDSILHYERDSVDFIKVDTEGAEFDVLKGAIESMMRKKIKFIQIEYGGTYPDAGITMKGVIEFIEKTGYWAYSYDGKFVKLNAETFIEDFHYDNYLISRIAL